MTLRAARRRILLIEDNPGDVELVTALVAEFAPLDEISHAPHLAAAAASLASTVFDVILLDLRLPDGDGVDSVQALRARSGDTPIIVLTGLEDEAVALVCISTGAQDYVNKSEMRATLRRAIDHALARVREGRERLRADTLRAHLAAIVESSNDAILSTDLEGIITTWNRGAERIFGYTSEEAVGRLAMEIIQPPGGRDPAEAGSRIAQLREGPDREAREVTRLRKDGAAITISSVASPLRDAAGNLFGVAAIARDITESKRRDEELRQRNAELLVRDGQMRALTVRLHATREEERTRISREVHDELGQLLTGLKMELRWIARRVAPNLQPPSTAAIAAKLTEADALIDRTIETVQRIAIELRPSVLDSLGLSAALRDEARRFERRTGAAIDSAIDEVTEPPSEVSTALFRVCQELLTNVARHAHATRVQLGLEESDTGWVLRVADDGVGLHPGASRRPTSLGLLGIKERIEALGGTFDLQSGRGRGTVAVVEVPARI